MSPSPAGPNRAAADQPVLRDFIVLGGLFFFGVVVVSATSWTPAQGIPRDLTGLVVGRDFLNFWMYGRAATMPEPGLWYDLSAYQSALSELLGENASGPNWSYPPSVMLLAAPFGQLPYLHALALWTVLSVGIFAWAFRNGERSVRLACLLSPTVAFGLISGQSSLVTATVMIVSFALLDRRPIVAGVLIGCMTLKPQLGLLFPVMLIASGRWRTFAAAVVATSAIVIGTTAAFGSQVWVDFVTKGLPVQNLVLADPNRIATPFYPTIFMNVRGVGASYAAAMALQAPFTLGAVAAVAWAFRRRRTADPRLLAALFFAASVTATPYLLSYDTLALNVCMLVLLAAGLLDARGRLLAKLVFWLCPIQLMLGTLHVPGPALIAPAVLLYLTLRLRAAAEAPQSVTPAQPAASPSGPAAS